MKFNVRHSYLNGVKARIHGLAVLMLIEKHRLDFSSFSSHNSFADLLSSQEAYVESGDGVDASMKVLTLQGNATIKFPTTRDDCLNEPSVCSGGFTVSFWLKHERKLL